MKRFLTMALAGVLALGLGSAAYAVECALDVVPASTLLFPFVEYDYDAGRLGDGGQTTLFAITNVSSEAQIVHVTVWTDYSVAILDFNLTLTGYDVQTINIRDILRDGKLPNELRGANIWEEDNGGIEPFSDGPFSSFNELYNTTLDTWFDYVLGVGLPPSQHTWYNYATAGLSGLVDCDPDEWDSSPNNYTIDIPGLTLGIFEDYLNASMTADTWYATCDIVTPDPATALPLMPVEFDGVWFTDNMPHASWMYVTADVVGACNKDLPDGLATTYFSTGNTFGLEVRNVLMGDYLSLNSDKNYSEGDNALHLEARPGIVTTPDDDGEQVTFYGRYHTGLGFADDREPLPTAWGFRFMYSELDQADTWIRAWKGGTNSAIIEDLNNGIVSLGPATLYANSCTPYTYYAWDEDEGVVSVEGGFVPPWSGGPINEPIPVPNLFPLETQEVNIGQFLVPANLDNGNKVGWMMVIWPRSNSYTAGGAPGVAGYLFDQYQTWMGVKYAAFGQYTAGLSGAVLANYNCDQSQVLPQLGIGMYTPTTP